METHRLTEDINVFYITVKPFPTGIIKAFKTLEGLHPSICERPFYGIFHQEEDGTIIYKAAVKEEYKGEGEAYHCKTFTIRKGIYVTELIIDFMKKIDVIPNAFHTLLAVPNIDTTFPCIEWYKSDKEVICMARLKNIIH